MWSFLKRLIFIFFGAKIETFVKVQMWKAISKEENHLTVALSLSLSWLFFSDIFGQTVETWASVLPSV